VVTRDEGHPRARREDHQPWDRTGRPGAAPGASERPRAASRAHVSGSARAASDRHRSRPTG
jgi:hypothetical protein